MDRDAALADILRQSAHPRLDPAFRLALLERRAQQIFRRRLAAAVLTALTLGVGLTVAARASADAMVIGALLLAGAGLVVSWRCYAPVLAHWLRAGFRASR